MFKYVPFWPRVIEVPAEMQDKDLWKLLFLYQFFYSVFGLLVSLALILLGADLVLCGIGGDTHWSVSVLGLEISDAAPGVALFFVGLLMAQITRFDQRLVLTKPTQPKKAE